jgi:PBSX family phage portal protein
MENLKKLIEFNDLEIDIEALSTTSKIVAPPSRRNDPFFKVYKSSLPDKERRRLTRLEKKVSTDKNEAQSKAKDETSFTSYDVYKLVPPPYDLDSLAKLYEINPAHNAAVTAKAYNIAGLGWELVEDPEVMFKQEVLEEKNKEQAKTYNMSLKRKQVKLMKQIYELNVEEEFGEIMVKVWTDVESMGNGYIEIGRNRDGSIGYIGHIPANTIRIRSARDGFIQITGDKYTFFRNFQDDAANPLGNDPNPNEVLHIKKYAPNSTYYGVPDIVAAMSAITGDKLAKDYNIEYFENKAVPRYAFITKGVRLSEESQQRLADFFTNELKGKNHGTLYIPLPATMNQNVDAKFEPIEVRPQEQSFDKYIKEARLEVLIVHRVPPSKVGVYENSNLAISRDADKTFKEQVCGPEQRRLERKLNRIMKEFTDEFVLKFKEADIIDADVRSRMHDRYLRTKVMSPNEVRREIGMPSDPEGDEFLPYPPQAGLPQNEINGGGRPQTRSQTPEARNSTGTRNQRGETQDSSGVRDRSSE